MKSNTVKFLSILPLSAAFSFSAFADSLNVECSNPIMQVINGGVTEDEVNLLNQKKEVFTGLLNNFGLNSVQFLVEEESTHTGFATWHLPENNPNLPKPLQNVVTLPMPCVGKLNTDQNFVCEVKSDKMSYLGFHFMRDAAQKDTFVVSFVASPNLIAVYQCGKEN